MKSRNLKISLIFSILGISLSSCRYTGEKLTPIFPDFSKQTVNTFRVKQVKPIEFELAEQGVPFSEVEKRQINKDLEPLVCFPISQVQEMRREWEKKQNNRDLEVHSVVDANTDSEGDATTRQVRMLNYP